jgi:hypothetical protein
MSTSTEPKKMASASNTSAISASAAPIVVKPPPADANIPSVPEGAEPTNGTDYRGIVPKKSELAVLGDVVSELENNAEFSALFGRTMPSVAYIIQVLTAANQWSLMRNKTDAWDLHARTQEGLTWMTARALMTKMKPVFEATASANTDVATQFPSLGLLLGAARVIAKRGVTTRKGNAKSKAKGDAPAKGAVAKEVRAATRVVADHAATGATTAQETAGGGAPAGSAQGTGTAVTVPAAVTAPVVAAGGAGAQAAPVVTAGAGVNGVAPDGTVGAHS